MKKLFAFTLTALLTVLLPTALKAQQQMVIVTQKGDLQVYPASAVGGLQYDAEQDVYTMTYNGETTTYGGMDIKQIYFADKSETDNDPYIEPQATDKYNPNFCHPEVGTYEILSMDKELCRTQVRFQGDVPQLYVGRILSLEDDERSYNLYVLTYKVDGKTADIRFRFAQIGEVLYNTEFALASNPADSYYAAADVQGDRMAVYGPKREKELGSIEIEEGLKVTAYADFGINVDTQDKSSLNIDAKLKLTEPKRNGSLRSYIAEVEYMGLIARGSYEKLITLTMKPKIGLKLDADILWDKPIVKLPPIKFLVPVGPVTIPVTLDLSATLGFNAQGDYNVEIEVQQQSTLGFGVTAGIEYDGHKTTPLFDVQPIFKAEKPKIVATNGNMMTRLSPYLRIDALIDVVFGGHVDLMPFLKCTYKGDIRGGVDDFGEFKMELGGNLRGGLYLNAPFFDKDDYVSGMTDDPISKVIYQSPSDLERKDNKVTYASMDTEDTRTFQVLVSYEDENVVPEWGQECSVMQSMETDMPDGQIIDVMGDGPAGARRVVVSPPLPAPVDLHQTGNEWGTKCDGDGIALTTFKSRVPLGYRTILKTRILDGDGNTIKEIEEEMLNEVKNFDATIMFGGYPGSIQYRDGGKYIFERVTGAEGTLEFRCQNGRMEVNLPELGWTAYGGNATPIAEAMHLYTPHVVQAYDYCRWMKEVLNVPTSGMSFGDKEHLGYKCKTVAISEGSITYWMNIVMEIIGETAFRVTSFQILD